MGKPPLISHPTSQNTVYGVPLSAVCATLQIALNSSNSQSALRLCSVDILDWCGGGGGGVQRGVVSVEESYGGGGYELFARHWVRNDVGVSDKRSDLRGLV